MSVSHDELLMVLYWRSRASGKPEDKSAYNLAKNTQEINIGSWMERTSSLVKTNKIVGPPHSRCYNNARTGKKLKNRTF